MKKIVLLAISCVVGVLVIGLSFNTYAQTSDITPSDALDDRNHYGQFSIDNVHVSEKDYYKVIFMDVHVKVKDLALEDGTMIFTSSITLVNENGKTYVPQGDECKLPTLGVSILGKDGGLGTYSTCFRVEKEFNNFKVYYRYDGADMKLHSYQIGNVDLNQKNEPTSNVVSDIKNINVTKPQDFFAQFFEWITNLFKFS